MQCVGIQDIDYVPGAIGGAKLHSYHILLEPGQTLDNSTLSQQKKVLNKIQIPSVGRKNVKIRQN